MMGNKSANDLGYIHTKEWMTAKVTGKTKKSVPGKEYVSQ